MLLSGGVSNPSTLTIQKKFAAAVEVEQSYMLNEARVVSAIAIQPVDKTVIGLIISHTGFTGYTASGVSVVLGRALGNVRLGTEFTFQHAMMTGNETSGSINAGISCRLQLSSVFNTGFRIRNIGGLFSKNENFYAPVVQAAAGYDVSESVHMGCEWMQEPGRSPVVVTGLLYQFHRLFIATFGMAWTPCQPYGGFQLQQHKWKLLMKTSFHPVLGWSPAVGISFGHINNDKQ